MSTYQERLVTRYYSDDETVLISARFTAIHDASMAQYQCTPFYVG